MLKTATARVLLPFLLVLTATLFGCDQLQQLFTPQEPPKPEPPTEFAVIKMKGGGEMHIRFMPDKAPNHVLNFKTLAHKGVYDGTTFHRVISGFMIQGGDPNTKDDDPSNDGLGGPGYRIPAEFNDVSHMRGIVSMARASDPDSAGSQFFIMVADRQPRPGGAPWASVLDGKYTAFGKIISGMEVADRIAAIQTEGRNNRPTKSQVMESIRIFEEDPAAQP